ncbi:MAG: biotin/lipoyl-binding protein [Deltaproteobacteria bacterium]|nr:biotin/lipoyl-binding protein [Deltaproteobacteria bacterium]
MLFYVHHNNQEYRVRVESRRDGLHIKFFDEREQPVDLVYYGNDCTFIHDNRVFHANIWGAKTDYIVWRPQGNLNFAVESEYKRLVGLLRGQDLDEQNNVYARMPGKIVKIIAKPGQHVKKGEAVLIMEAMKMENEIRATINGEILKISVKEGEAVETGATLAEINPAEED